jgi:hypothetical protein
MTSARIDFADLGRRPRLEPVVLVAGLPVVFTVAGVMPTAATVSSGTVDPLWWPGVGSLTETLPDGSTWNPVRDLLDPTVVWSLRSALELLRGEVKVEALAIDLFDRGGAATALLSRRAAAAGQLLAAEVSASSSTWTLGSTLGFAAGGGIAHCGREAISYAGKTSTTLTGVVRGLYGSAAMPHRVTAARGASNPMVTAGSLPRYVQGRRATVWLCRVSADGTTLTDPTLLFTGLVGAGVTMVRGGTRWQLTLDPLTEALARAPDLPVELYGWHHLANSSPYDFSLMATVLGGLGPNINGGWSPNLAEVVSKWNEQLQAATSIRIAPANGQLTLTNSAGSPIEVGSILEPRRVMVPANGTASFDSAPDTLLVMEGGIKLDVINFARIPSTLSHSVTDPAPGAAYIALVADTDETEHFTAQIVLRDATNRTISLAARSTDRASDRITAARITERTTAKVGILATGATAIGALRALAVAMASLGGVDDFDSAVDWDRIASVFRSVPTVGLPEGRAYEIGSGDDTLLNLLADECRLRGATLTMRGGRISAVRAASFAASEAVGVTQITARDVLTDSGVPVPYEVIDQPEPPATSVAFELRDGTTLRYTDDTFASEFGSTSVVECKALSWVAWVGGQSPRGVTGDQLAQVAQQILGVLAEPQRIVRVTLGQRFMGLEPGDLVLLTHDEIPSWDGTRGVSNLVCQVDEVSRELFGGKGRVTASLRVSDSGLGGYAPAALVSVDGISGSSAIVALDNTSAFGPSCFAPPGESPTYGFEVGDVVTLGQYDAATITVSEVQRTIVAIDRVFHSITLSSAPSAGLVALAGTQYALVLRTAAWTQATAAPVGDVPAQRDRFAFVANDSTGAFSDSAAAKRFAS